MDTKTFKIEMIQEKHHHKWKQKNMFGTLRKSQLIALAIIKLEQLHKVIK